MVEDLDPEIQLRYYHTPEVLEDSINTEQKSQITFCLLVFTFHEKMMTQNLQVVLLPKESVSAGFAAFWRKRC